VISLIALVIVSQALFFKWLPNNVFFKGVLFYDWSNSLLLFIMLLESKKYFLVADLGVKKENLAGIGCKKENCCPNQEIRGACIFKGLVIGTYSYFGVDSTTLINTGSGPFKPSTSTTILVVGPSATILVQGP
jgi:hypothetical protein